MNLEEMKAFFVTTFYVQISSNAMVFRNCRTAQSVTLTAELHFTHERMLIGDFTHASALMKKGFKELGRSIFAMSPQVLLHPLEKLEGGLTRIEERALQELALGAGAWKAHVWVGEPLSNQAVIEKIHHSGKK